MLSPRQELLLRKVVDEFASTGSPVGSKMLAGDNEISWGASTVRHELAILEEFGLLAHPHTSAGRIPTDAGYRYYVDHFLPHEQVGQRSVELSLVRREVDDAVRLTTEALADVTNLLAIVSAPPVQTATIRHIEVLLLQRDVLMIVIITSAGAVTKRLFEFDRPVDPGLASWAGSYLNEKLMGIGLGARTLQSRLADPTLRSSERNFIAQLMPAFTELTETPQDAVHVEGASRLLSEYQYDPGQLNALLEMLERRVSLLGVLSSALAERDIYVRIGRENETPALHSLSLVAANYGLPQRNLGTVSVIGPTRMNYPVAVAAVREAAQQLSRFIEDVYNS